MIVCVYVKNEKEHRALNRVARTPDHLKTRTWKDWKGFPYRKINHRTQTTGICEKPHLFLPVPLSVPEFLNLVGNQPAPKKEKRKIPDPISIKLHLKSPDERLACVVRTIKGKGIWTVGLFVYAKASGDYFTIRPEGQAEPVLDNVPCGYLSFAEEYDLKDAQETIRCLENSRKG